VTPAAVRARNARRLVSCIMIFVVVDCEFLKALADSVVLVLVVVDVPVRYVLVLVVGVVLVLVIIVVVVALAVGCVRERVFPYEKRKAMVMDLATDKQKLMANED